MDGEDRFISTNTWPRRTRTRRPWYNEAEGIEVDKGVGGDNGGMVADFLVAANELRNDGVAGTRGSDKIKTKFDVP